MTVDPQCYYCKHFHLADKQKNACDAFPDGIPGGVFLNLLDHRKPIDGDHGIQFEPKDA